MTEVNDKIKKALKVGILRDMKLRPYMYSNDVLEVLFNGVKDHELFERIKNDDSSDPLLSSFILSDQTLEHEDLVNARIIPDYLSVETLLRYNVPIPQIEEIDNNQNCLDVIFLGDARSGKSIVSASIMERLRNNGLGSYESSTITNRYYYDLLSCFQKKKFPCSSAMGAVHYALYDIQRKGSIRIISPGNSIIYELGNNIIDPDYLKNNNRKILLFMIDSSLITEREDCYCRIPSFQISLCNCLHYLCHNGTDDSGRKGCTMSNVCTIVLLFTKFDVVGLSNRDEANEWMKRQIKEKLIGAYYELEKICRCYAINSAVRYKPLIMNFSVGKEYIGNTFDYDPQDANNITQFILSQIPYKRSFWNILNNQLIFSKK